MAQIPDDRRAPLEAELADLEAERAALLSALEDGSGGELTLNDFVSTHEKWRRVHGEWRRVKLALLDLQLAEIRDLVRDGKKAEAAAAMKELERAQATFDLARAAVKKDLEWAQARFDLARVALKYFSEPVAVKSKEVFRDKEYIAVQIGSSLSVYNSLQLDQQARVRHLLKEYLLSLIKEFAKATDGADTYGLLVSLSVPYRNFLDSDQSTRYDSLRVYVPTAEIKRFAEHEITSQDLVDASVVIVNDGRVAVSLE